MYGCREIINLLPKKRDESGQSVYCWLFLTVGRKRCNYLSVSQHFLLSFSCTEGRIAPRSLSEIWSGHVTFFNK